MITVPIAINQSINPIFHSLSSLFLDLCSPLFCFNPFILEPQDPSLLYINLPPTLSSVRLSFQPLFRISLRPEKYSGITSVSDKGKHCIVKHSNK